MGFSAGGHLASTAGTHFDAGDPKSPDPIERVSCRPDFLVLCYAVIALGEPYANRGSQDNLLGKNPDPALVRSLSSEKQVTPQTPPTFLFHTDRDQAVPPENAVQFYLALAVPACRPSCTSTPPAPTASAWRKPPPARRPGRSG